MDRCQTSPLGQGWQMLEEGAALPLQTIITYNITFTMSRHFAFFIFHVLLWGHFAVSGQI
jgi:hypothetical protein